MDESKVPNLTRRKRTIGMIVIVILLSVLAIAGIRGIVLERKAMLLAQSASDGEKLEQVSKVDTTVTVDTVKVDTLEKKPAVVMQKSTPPKSKYEPIDPSELAFELRGYYMRGIVGSDGTVPSGGFDEFLCEGQTLELESNEFQDGFILTKDYGKIKIRFSNSIHGDGFSIWLTAKQKAALKKALKSGQ